MNKIFTITFTILIYCSSILFSQAISPYIVVDQFGYRPSSAKFAVVRDPQVGYDASESFTPGTNYVVKDSKSEVTVFTGQLSVWNNGNTDVVSGDKVWWFDFSDLTKEGSYYVVDVVNNVRSATFMIADTVYKPILKAALKVLYYQRAGYAKTAAYAGIAWADGASHLGTLQDKNCRLYTASTNASTERDLSGGWYDAGDYNKYTPWTANYVVSLILSYKENPAVFTDDFHIPESGNGIPDILDEVKWGIDWLLKMQQKDGSCLSVMGVAHASPPSSATGQSLYGPATTNATFRTAAAFAISAKYLKQANPVYFGTYADTLEARAYKAWNWAINNPSAKFNNTTAGVAAGNQETDDNGLFAAKMGAALYMYELTGDNNFLNEFESNYLKFPLFAWTNYVSQYFQESSDLLLYYTGLETANVNISNSIKTATLTGLKRPNDYIGALNTQTDPYRAFIADYNWGSNQYKSGYGTMFWQVVHYNLDPNNNSHYLNASEDYIHYIHGVNPFNLVYLTQMGSYGAENNIKEIYHSWFHDRSAKWDREGVSTYGPAPGFLAGGPNDTYTLDGCCTNNSCGSPANNALCTSIVTAPPSGQPSMKSYKDFNSSWPLNSWQITENSNGYQVSYIRLLSKFAKNASPQTSINDALIGMKMNLTPNPCKDFLTLGIPDYKQGSVEVEIFNASGINLTKEVLESDMQIYTGDLAMGLYYVKVYHNNKLYIDKFVKAF